MVQPIRTSFVISTGELIVKRFLMVLAAVLCSACAGVSINPISIDKAKQSHASDGNLTGYIFYSPVVVVELSDKVVCLSQKPNQGCEKSEITCSAGTPFVLPDYSKPFVVDIHSGFGKAGADISFKDGWLLSQVKDASDNTAVLGLVEKALTAGTKGVPVEKPTEGKVEPERRCAPGLYRVELTDKGIQLLHLELYGPKP